MLMVFCVAVELIDKESVKFLLLSSLFSNHGTRNVVLIEVVFLKASSVCGCVLQYFSFCPVILELEITCVHSARQLVRYGAEV